MSKRRVLGAVLAFSCLFVVAACGDDDDGSGGGETPDIGTCDRSSTVFYCIEMHDPTSIDLANQEESCDSAGGASSNEPCPTEASLGCCDYEILDQSGGPGSVFRECFYESYAEDPEALCASVDGTWTPAN